MSGLVAYAPTLYRAFCAATGYGGTVKRAVGPETADTAVPRSGRPITVYFDANVDPGLDWSFRPAQNKVQTRIGEPTKVYYTATNRSDETIVARAVYNVTPYKIAPYFFKIECFCFTEERLAPGESARMPLVFFVDHQMEADGNADDVNQITLSYTFFRQEDLSPDDVAAARDLKAASVKRDQELTNEGKEAFDNDAPRR